MGATWWQHLQVFILMHGNDSDEEYFADHVIFSIEAAQESGNELSDECNFEPIPENDDS